MWEIFLRNILMENFHSRYHAKQNQKFPVNNISKCLSFFPNNIWGTCSKTRYLRCRGYWKTTALHPIVYLKLKTHFLYSRAEAFGPNGFLYSRLSIIWTPWQVDPVKNLTEIADCTLVQGSICHAETRRDYIIAPKVLSVLMLPRETSR